MALSSCGLWGRLCPSCAPILCSHHGGTVPSWHCTSHVAVSRRQTRRSAPGPDGGTGAGAAPALTPTSSTRRRGRAHASSCTPWCTRGRRGCLLVACPLACLPVAPPIHTHRVRATCGQQENRGRGRKHRSIERRLDA